MTKWVNGEIIEMTPEEIEAMRQETEKNPVPEADSVEERLKKLEDENRQLQAQIDALTDGRVG